MSKLLRHIDIELNSASINRAIREIKYLQKQLEEQVGELVKRLMDEGIQIAKAEIVTMDALFSGELESSIRGIFYKKQGCGYVYTNAPHALYVEYGTGFQGAGGSKNDAYGGWDTYPGEMAEGYQPDATGHGADGWWYPAPWGWWIPKEGTHAGQPMAWTNGMPSRPFMYDTLIRLEEMAPEWARDMFSQM